MVAQKAEAKKERGEGPMIVTYADKAGKNDLKRASTDVVSVVVQQRVGGNKKVYEISKLPPAVKDALAAMAFAQRSKVHVANNGNDKGDNVISLADAMWADLAAGKIYSRSADGEKPGRKFDPVPYADAMRIAMANMNKKGRTGKNGKVVQAMSDKQYADFQAKLNGMAPKERTDFIRGLKKDSFIAAAMAEVEYRNKQKDIDEDDSFDLNF